MHRLDRDTSGCLLLARNPKARARFQQAFERGDGRENLSGGASTARSPGEEGLIDLAARQSFERRGRLADGGRRGAASRPRRAGASSREADGQSLVEFRPLTGRTHQIRVHAARGLGAAIVGDPVYRCPTMPSWAE